MSASVQAHTILKLEELSASNIQESDLPRLPYMTGWFELGLLLKLLMRVIVSDLFGQYADRRLIEAALDPADKDTHIQRAKIDTFEPDQNGDIWIDYVSDLGDGFDATYAIAYQIGQPELKIGDTHLRRASVLVMGGDEVYPTALRDDYKIKMRLPYELAWPLPKEQAVTPIYLLPGNHDWYDGLVNFLAIFCREKGMEIGGWKTRQRRSYFAVRVTDDWWIWGIDIALVHDVDQPQADYFEAIASGMDHGANIILCSAEPGWYKANTQSGSYRTLSYASSIARKAKKDLRIPLVLSGDSHHYARYVSDDAGGGTQYITSGGGGAFLHGTLELKPTIEAQWLQSPKEMLTLAECYPSQEESRNLLNGNKYFGALNKGLTYFFACTYIMFAFILTYVWRTDVATGLFLILFGGIFGYLWYQENDAKKVFVPAALHSSLHFAVVAGTSWIALELNRRYLPLFSWHWALWFAALALPLIAIGPWISGKIFGHSLVLGCKRFDIGHNDAFSSMRLNSHRHFLRMRIRNGELTVYPVKLAAIPSRDQWRKKMPNAPTSASVFAAEPALAPSLLEKEIIVNARAAISTSEIKVSTILQPQTPTASQT